MKHLESSQTLHYVFVMSFESLWCAWEYHFSVSILTWTRDWVGQNYKRERKKICGHWSQATGYRISFTSTSSLTPSSPFNNLESINFSHIYLSQMSFKCTIMQICDTTEQFMTHIFNDRKGPHKYRASLHRNKLVSCIYQSLILC